MLPEPVSRLSAEVIIVGGGVAGVTAAAVLAQQGRRVILLDSRSAYPPVFKAEKVEQDELRVLREFGLLEPLLPHSGRSSEVYVASGDRIFRRKPMEQIGIPYADLVNILRANLPAGVETRLGQADRIIPGAGKTSVRLTTGEELTARLVVLACGISDPLLSSLGLWRRVIQKEQCVGLGFDVATSDSRPFPFQSLTYYPTNAAYGIDYLTLFKIRHTMRANLFIFRPADDPWIRAFHSEPELLLQHAMPKLSRVIGEYQVMGSVVSSRVDLYRTEGRMPDGVVLIGDALQTACPSTGLGIKKVLTDVNVLAECAPQWFSTPGMSVEKINGFYDHQRKRSVDAHALQRALYQRRAATSQSLRWRVYRALLHLRRSLSPSIKLSPSLQPRKFGAAPIPTLESQARGSSLGAD